MYSRTRALALSLTLILVPSVWKAKHTHSHSLKQEGQAHSLSDEASHSLIHRMEATLTFTRRQTRRVEGTCTHKHLVSLRDSHSGGQRTHSHALTENGRTTHSHVPTGGNSSLSQGMEEALTDPITLSHRGDSPLTLILSY